MDKVRIFFHSFFFYQWKNVLKNAYQCEQKLRDFLDEEAGDGIQKSWFKS